MTADEERIDKVLDSLSKARTALDDPWGLPAGVGEELPNQPEKLKEYAIDKIDDAMRLLSPEKDKPEFGLMVAHNDVLVSRRFHVEDETIEAVGEALERKLSFPDDDVSIRLVRV